ncbi:hypothetical protein EIP91_008684 [Steccherinum ochraceum]|uniref:Uncharacterized protein n=1 Tax=Steccherinum ochraceum TaxID=92696 RepID=A0A4R0RCF2_9APHY|nr:hypothetical protein EIP91_008684 [Steccherinum ochraceum]
MYTNPPPPQDEPPGPSHNAAPLQRPQQASSSRSISQTASTNVRVTSLARELQDTTTKLRLLQSMLDEKIRQNRGDFPDKRDALRVQESIRVYKQDVKDAEAKQDQLIRALQAPAEPQRDELIDLTMDDDG